MKDSLILNVYHYIYLSHLWRCKNDDMTRWFDIFNSFSLIFCHFLFPLIKINCKKSKLKTSFIFIFFSIMFINLPLYLHLPKHKSRKKFMKNPTHFRSHHQPIHNFFSWKINPFSSNQNTLIIIDHSHRKYTVILFTLQSCKLILRILISFANFPTLL